VAGAQAIRALATAVDGYSHGASLEVYAALNARGAEAAAPWPAFPVAYSIPPEAAQSDIAAAANTLVGAAFMVRQAVLCKGAGILVNVAAVGGVSAPAWVGGTLFAVAANGDWTFLANTGASKGAPPLQSVGWKNWTWRDAADTADVPYQLDPGVVYVASYAMGTHSGSQPRLVAASPLQGAGQFGYPGGFRRVAGTANSAKRQSDVTVAQMANFNAIPMIAIYK